MLIKPLVLIAALLLCGRPATAQPGSDPPIEVLESCLLGTHDGTWARLKLTTDQLQRMHFVQEACKEECETPGVKKKDNPISNADGSTVMSEVRAILSADQYRAWVAYCTENTPDGQAPR